MKDGNRTGRFLLWIALIAASIGLDQITKAFFASLQDAAGMTIIPGLIRFSYVENTGAAFGIFKGQRWLFLIFSSIAIVVMLVYLIVRRKEIPGLLGTSLAMVIGGGIGNQIDRFLNGYVVDFMEFTFFEFPVFNVADSFVTVGVFLIVIWVIVSEIQTAKKKPEQN